jgi:hypothetical protein
VKAATVWRIVITFLVAVSLAGNIFLLRTLLDARQALRMARDTARDALVSFSSEPVMISIAIDEEIPVRTSVAFNETLVVPFEMDYILSTVVNTYINIPILGRQSVAVPVEAVIPISETFAIPIAVSVPVSMTYPLNVELPVAVELPKEVITGLIGYLDALDHLLGAPTPQESPSLPDLPNP